MTSLDLVEIASYPNSFEASLARNHLEVGGIPAVLGNEAMVNWFGYYGSMLGGVRLLVERQHADEARQLLTTVNQEIAAQARQAKQREAEDPEDQDAPDELPAELLRAWRSAMVGMVILPVLLHFYSMYLLCKSRLFIEATGHINWRVPLALVINLFFLGTFAALVMFIFFPRSFSSGPSFHRNIELPLAPAETPR